jgi:hypothetical protein
MWENQGKSVLVSIHLFLSKAGFQCASLALQQECIEKGIGSLSGKVFPDSELDQILSNYFKLYTEKENFECKQPSITNSHLQRSVIVQVPRSLLIFHPHDCMSNT